MLEVFGDGRDSDHTHCACLRYRPAQPSKDDALPPTVTVPGVGERVELDRYTIRAGERILYGQRIHGRVRITDVPASPPGRSYLVERDLQQDGHAALQALIEDYVQQAHELDEVPMMSSLLRRELQQRTSDA